MALDLEGGRDVGTFLVAFFILALLARSKENVRRNAGARRLRDLASDLPMDLAGFSAINSYASAVLLARVGVDHVWIVLLAVVFLVGGLYTVSESWTTMCLRLDRNKDTMEWKRHQNFAFSASIFLVVFSSATVIAALLLLPA